MTHVSLFSGIGGIDLAAHWAGFRTIQFVEKDPFCQSVLRKNFPGVPIHDDISTFDGKPFRGRTDLVSGGFPCQDISQANKVRAGLDGARSGLWFRMLETIADIRPRWVVAENVAALANMGIDVCFDGLEHLGYEVGAVIAPAAGVGAWHKRDRIFIIGSDNLQSAGLKGQTTESHITCADPHELGMQQSDGQTVAERELHDHEERECQVEEQTGIDELRGACPNASGARHERQERNERGSEGGEVSQRKCNQFLQDFGERSRLFEPKLCGDLHGLPGGLHTSRKRLAALGNAVVPQQVYPILKAIAEAA